MARVLVVDDERRLCKSIAYNPKAEGHEPLVAHDGQEALAMAREQHPDLIILDLMLPKLSGWEVCRALRRESVVPVLMLTAKTEETDKVAGLELGADDYVTKPFGMRELMARVKALLRRSQGTSPTLLSVGDLVIDVEAHEVRRNQELIVMPPKEFDLLTELARNVGRTVPRDTLLRRVWGDDFVGDGHTLEVHVRWLREKLEEDPSHPQRLKTVRGVGYRLEA